MKTRVVEFTEDDGVRFWAKVDRSGGPESCWPWIASRNVLRGGYGTFGLSRRGMKATFRAHRVAWQFTHGPIPSGMVLCHRCDNPPCCNPGHLFLGTQADNHYDMDAKGRQGRPPLAPADIAEIRRQRRAGVEAKELARLFDRDPSSISRISRGAAFGPIDPETPAYKAQARIRRVPAEKPPSAPCRYCGAATRTGALTCGGATCRKTHSSTWARERYASDPAFRERRKQATNRSRAQFAERTEQTEVA